MGNIYHERSLDSTVGQITEWRHRNESIATATGEMFHETWSKQEADRINRTPGRKVVLKYDLKNRVCLWEDLSLRKVLELVGG